MIGGHAEIRHRRQAVLAVRARTSESDAARFVHAALAEIHAFMKDHDVAPAGPPFTIVNRTGHAGTIDVEAGWPVDRAVNAGGNVHSGTLPSALVGHSSTGRRSSR